MNEQQNDSLPVTGLGAECTASPSFTGDPSQMRLERQETESGNFAPPGLVEDYPKAIGPLAQDDAGELAKFSPIPKIRRVSMTPRPIDRQPLRRLWRELTRQSRSTNGLNKNHRQSC